jgi:hypothetical protein
MRRQSVIAFFAGLIVTTFVLVAPSAAQQTAPPAAPAMAAPSPFEQTQVPPPAAPGQTSRTVTAIPPAAAPPAQQPPSPPKPADPAQMVNVRIELAITETQGSNAAVKKTVVLITRSDSFGQVRSVMNRPDNGSMALNVDVRPHVEKDGRIDLNVTFKYQPEQATEAVKQGDLSESMDVFLVDGKPLLISQSADPKGDRKVTVEVTATVIK